MDGCPVHATAEPAVIAEAVYRTYQGNWALRGVSLRIEAGEIAALLGRNGAGKTTFVRVLTTLLPPDSGTVRVNGWNVVTHPTEARSTLGVSGQYSTVDGQLTGFENLYLVAKLRGMGRRSARRTADELLDRFGLTEASGRRVDTYSGGMRRRVDLAAALVGEPPLVILDEPTTGLDPDSRLSTWEAVTALAERGTAVLLTTQYLEEADRLADRVTVLDSGQVVAAGTSDELKESVGGSRLVLSTATQPALREAAEATAHVLGVRPTADVRARRIEVTVTDGQAALTRLLAELERRGVPVTEACLHRASLDDVFFRLTARTASAGAV